MKPKTSLEGLCWLLNDWNEAQSTVWTFGLPKEADIASPDTCQCLKLPFEPFTSPWIHLCYNHLRVNRPKFRLETNSTVVWQYAGGVNSIVDGFDTSEIVYEISWFQSWFLGWFQLISAHEAFSLRENLFNLQANTDLTGLISEGVRDFNLMCDLATKDGILLSS